MFIYVCVCIKHMQSFILPKYFQPVWKQFQFLASLLQVRRFHISSVLSTHLFVKWKLFFWKSPTTSVLHVLISFSMVRFSMNLGCNGRPQGVLWQRNEKDFTYQYMACFIYFKLIITRSITKKIIFKGLPKPNMSVQFSF